MIWPAMSIQYSMEQNSPTTVRFNLLLILLLRMVLFCVDFSGFARHLIALKCNSIGDVYDQQAVHIRIQNRSGQASHRTRLF